MRFCEKILCGMYHSSQIYLVGNYDFGVNCKHVDGICNLSTSFEFQAFFPRSMWKRYYPKGAKKVRDYFLFYPKTKSKY